jgi:hypothetical protein
LKIHVVGTYGKPLNKAIIGNTVESALWDRG